MTEEQYTDNQIDWVVKHIDTELKSVREAVNKVEVTNTAKFEAQNEWRQQFKDQTANFVTRKELWAAVIALAGIVTGILSLILK